MLSIISLIKIRKTMAKKSYATNYGNHYSTVNNIIDLF